MCPSVFPAQLLPPINSLRAGSIYLPAPTVSSLRGQKRRSEPLGKKAISGARRQCAGNQVLSSSGMTRRKSSRVELSRECTPHSLPRGPAERKRGIWIRARAEHRAGEHCPPPEALGSQQCQQPASNPEKETGISYRRRPAQVCKQTPGASGAGGGAEEEEAPQRSSPTPKWLLRGRR